MKENIKDLVIIGSGPAGLSAAIYGCRAMLDLIVIEKNIYGGGQIAVTDRVDNYLGLNGLSGYDLAMKFKEHAKEHEVPILEADVIEIKDGKIKEVVLDDGTVIKTKAVIISTGADHRKLGIKGEEELLGAGVSYCATCDGAFFRNQKVAVVGGGDVALADALYLANICEKVYLIHRRDSLRGAKILQEKIFASDKVEFIPDSEIEEIIGKNMVEGISIFNNKTNEKNRLEVSGVFVAVGMNPNTELVKNIVSLDKTGYIVADESCRTSAAGIYAIGDVRTKQLRQVVTAVADGAVAISSIEVDRLSE